MSRLRGKGLSCVEVSSLRIASRMCRAEPADLQPTMSPSLDCELSSTQWGPVASGYRRTWGLDARREV